VRPRGENSSGKGGFGVPSFQGASIGDDREKKGGSFRGEEWSFIALGRKEVVAQGKAKKAYAIPE